MSKKLPTVRVKEIDGGEDAIEMIINKSDYDPEKHKIVRIALIEKEKETEKPVVTGEVEKTEDPEKEDEDSDKDVKTETEFS